MPRKRIQPNKRWLPSRPPRPAVRPLSTAQHSQLKTIEGLPEAALPEIEEIAKRTIRNADYPTPTKAEMRASLRLLKSRIEALERQVKETDLYTMNIMSANYRRKALRDPTADFSYADLPTRVLSDLSQFRLVLQFVDLALIKDKAPRPSSPAVFIASLIRDHFLKFDVPFSLSQDSPAVETVSKILNMIRSTGLDAAQHAVRRMMQEGDKRSSSVRSRI